MNKLLLSIIFAFLLFGIVYAGGLINKSIELDKSVLDKATLKGVSYSNITYTKTTIENSSVICLYDSGSRWICRSGLSLADENKWIKFQIEERLKAKSKDVITPTKEEGKITITAKK